MFNKLKDLRTPVLFTSAIYDYDCERVCLCH